MFNRERQYVALISISFWIWLAKDMVFKIVNVSVQSGQLPMVLIIAMIPILISSMKRYRAYNTNPTKNDMRFIAIFFLYCFLSAFTTGLTPYSIFKLHNLFISIVMAYVLSYKIVRAMLLNQRIILIIGLLIGILGNFAIFINAFENIQNDAIGLRILRVAVLNIQDYYVVLLLLAISVLFSKKFKSIDIYLLITVMLISLPIIIGINSRMLPFTLGGAFSLTLFKYRTRIIHFKSILALVGLSVFIFVIFQLYGDTFINRDSRLLSVFGNDFGSIWMNDPRSFSFNKAFQDFQFSPIFGVGFGKFSLYSTFSNSAGRLLGTWPHNLFLELLSELGIVGFVLFIIFAVKKGKIITMKRLHTDTLIFPFFFFSYIMLTVQLTQNLYYPLLWLSLVMVRVQKSKLYNPIQKIS